eukprot:jgi/Psemu1/40725/gm1.40725_g
MSTPNHPFPTPPPLVDTPRIRSPLDDANFVIAATLVAITMGLVFCGSGRSNRIQKPKPHDREQRQEQKQKQGREQNPAILRTKPPPCATSSLEGWFPAFATPCVRPLGTLWELSTVGFGGFLARHRSTAPGGAPIVSACLPGGATTTLHLVTEPAAFASVFRYGPKHLSMGPAIADFSATFFGMSKEGLACFDGGARNRNRNRNRATTALHEHFLRNDGLRTLVRRGQDSLLKHTRSALAGLSSWSSTTSTEEPKPPTTTTSTTMDLYDFVRKTMFYATLETTISESECIVNERFVRLYETFDKAIPKAFAGMPLWLTAPESYRAREQLVAILTSSSSSSSSSSSPTWIPSDYLKSRRAFLESLRMSEDDIARDNLLWVFGACTNFVPSQFWHLYHVIANEEAFSAIRDEVDAIVRNRKRKRNQHQYQHRDSTSNNNDEDEDEDETAGRVVGIEKEETTPAGRGLVFSPEELDEMVGLESAFRETIRLTMTGMVMREVMQDMELDLRLGHRNGDGDGDDGETQTHPHPTKYFLTKGSSVVLYPPLLHHDPTVFPEPRKYQWDRFLLTNKTKQPETETKTETGATTRNELRSSRGYAIRDPFCGFGGGAHYCPGRKFASNMAKAFVANLVYNYDMELVSEDQQQQHCHHHQQQQQHWPQALEYDVARDAFGLLHPKSGVRVRFSDR